MQQIYTATESGRWLTLALDPNHDTPVMPSGLPDALYPNTIVRKFNYSTEVKCPSSIVTGTWDCHIRSSPVLSIRNSSTFTGNNDNAIGVETLTANTLWNEAGVTIQAVQSGASTYSHPVNGEFSYIQPTSSIFEVGPVRVIGYALETINTTAPIYQQGSIVAYRYDPLCEISHQTLKTSGSASTVVFSSVGTAEYFGPPTNKASALLYQNSVELRAADGCYSVGAINNLEGGFKSSTNRCINMSSNVTAASSSQELWWAQNITGGGATQQLICAPYSCLADIDTVGHYFSGLSLQTTLTVKYTLIVESIPDLIDFRPLASPSAQYDFEVLEAYRKAVAILPSGVPSEHNASGKWWKEVVKTVNTVWRGAKWAVKAAKAAKIPLANEVGNAMNATEKAVKAGANAVNQVNQVRRKAKRSSRSKQLVSVKPK